MTPGGFSAHGYSDPYNYPGLPLIKRLILAANPDLTPDDLHGVGEGDGMYDEAAGLLANHDWHIDLAIAEAMGLQGDWGVDDVNEAVTDALHEYRDLRARLEHAERERDEFKEGQARALADRESVEAEMDRRVMELLARAHYAEDALRTWRG